MDKYLLLGASVGQSNLLIFRAKYSLQKNYITIIFWCIFKNNNKFEYFFKVIYVLYIYVYDVLFHSKHIYRYVVILKIATIFIRDAELFLA